MLRLWENKRKLEGSFDIRKFMAAHYRSPTWLPKNTWLKARDVETGRVRKFLVSPPDNARDPTISHWPAGGPLRVNGRTYDVLSVHWPNGRVKEIKQQADVDRLVAFASAGKGDSIQLPDDAISAFRDAALRLGQPVPYALAVCWWQAGIGMDYFDALIHDLDHIGESQSASFSSWISQQPTGCKGCSERMGETQIGSLVLLACKLQEYRANPVRKQRIAAGIVKLMRRLALYDQAISFAERAYPEVSENKARAMLLVTWAATQADRALVAENSKRDKERMLSEAATLASQAIDLVPPGSDRQHAYCVLIRIASLMKNRKRMEHWKEQAELEGAECPQRRGRHVERPLGFAVRVSERLLNG